MIRVGRDLKPILRELTDKVTPDYGVCLSAVTVRGTNALRVLFSTMEKDPLFVERLEALLGIPKHDYELNFEPIGDEEPLLTPAAIGYGGGCG